LIYFDKYKRKPQHSYKQSYFITTEPQNGTGE